MNHAVSDIGFEKGDVSRRQRNDELATFWSLPVAELAAILKTDLHGLTSEEVNRRLRRYGPNRLKAARKTDWLTLLVAQFKTPLILILLGASVISFFLNRRWQSRPIVLIRRRSKNHAAGRSA